MARKQHSDAKRTAKAKAETKQRKAIRKFKAANARKY